MRYLFWLVVFLITYGSLFPFNFSSAMLEDGNTLLYLTKFPSVGDILGNIALFIPLGLVLRAQSLASNKSTNYIKVLLQVFVFSLILQLLQYYLPSRDQNIFDVLFNLIGFYIAWVIFSLIPVKMYSGQEHLSLLPIGIACFYFASELIPFIPSLDFQLIKTSLKPLMTDPVDWFDVISSTIFWLLALKLINTKDKSLSFYYFLILWLGFIVGKLVIYHNYLTAADLISPIFAMALLKIQSFKSAKSLFVLITMTVMAYLSKTIESFSPEVMHTFNIVPFAEFLQGDLETNTRNLLFKIFAFSALLWLSLEARLNLKKVAFSLFLFLLVVEVFQLWMVTKASGISDPLLALICYVFVRNIGDFLVTKQNQDVTKIIKKNIPKPEILSAIEPRQVSRSNTYQLLRFLLQIFTMYIFVQVGLSLPNIPYNASELFRNNGSLIDIALFYCSLTLIGGTGVLMGSRIAALDGFPPAKQLVQVLTSLLVYLAITFCMFSFLYLSVNEESIFDIIGSALIVPYLYELEASDTFMGILIRVFSLTNITAIARYIELSLRFIALLGLLQIPLVFFSLSFNNILKSMRQKVITGAVCLALSGLCFYVVFIEPATDNLTELVERSSVMVFMGYLLALNIIICTKIVSSGKQLKYLALFILPFIVAVILWFMAQYAFKLEVEKYGQVFSAFDFLLGPSREVKLAVSTLFLRWILLVVAIQVICILGIQNTQLLLKASQTVFKVKEFKWLLGYKKRLVNFALLMLLAYGANRLFGSHAHWQTLYTYFNKTGSTEITFSLDNSVVDVPLNAEPGIVTVDGKRVASIAQAFRAAKDNSFITIAKGHYNEAAIITANSVRVIAEQGAVIYGKAVAGKGAILVQGNDTYIKGIECHSIKVSDNNGSCIRHEGKGITLDNVYFHHAQGGLLGSPKGGDIFIKNSRFENLGQGAFFHGVYTFEKTRLYIDNSIFLNNRNAGHEIKSRSRHTEITNSIVASPNSKDSRLVDVPNGGTLILRGNIFVEGPFSENHDLFSWGVEGIKYPNGEVLIEENLIIIDKPYANLISLKEKPSRLHIFNNISVGSVNGIAEDSNTVFDNRKDANISPAPFIPNLKR